VINESDKSFVKKEDLDVIVKFIAVTAASGANIARAGSRRFESANTQVADFIGGKFLMNVISKSILNESSLDAIRILNKWFYIEGYSVSEMSELIEKCVDLLLSAKLNSKAMQKEFIELIRLLNKLLTEEEILKNIAVEPFYDLNFKKCNKVIKFTLGSILYTIRLKRKYSLGTILRKIANKIGVDYSMVILCM
jgi:hypothetical protein